MDLPDLKLDKKIGPLPLSAWIAVIGLGLAGAYLLQRRQGGASSTPATAVAGEGLAFTDPLGGGGYAPPRDPLSPVTPISSPNGAPESNAAWVNYAAKTLTTLKRPWSGSVILAALQRYVNGKSLDATQTAIVDDAIRQAGYPPEPVIDQPDPTPTAPSPAPGTTGTAGYERIPPQQRKDLGKRYTRVQQIGSRGERPDEIARRVYGSSSYASTLDWINQAVRPPYTSPLPIGIQIAY